MGVDIDPGDVRDELLIAVFLDIKDQQALVMLSFIAVPLGPEEQPQLERHVEPRQAIVAIELGPTNVVYAVPAFLDQIVELVDASLAAIVQLARRSGPEAARKDRENQRLEDWFVIRVEGTVYENVVR